jgi:hypothetical protein
MDRDWPCSQARDTVRRSYGGSLSSAARQMRSGSVRKAWIASAAAALACLVAAPGANAAIGFGDGLSAQPADTQAGANSDFTINMPFTGSGPDDSVRDLTIHLPPGLIGNPTATPLCAVAQLNSDAGCPPATQVGEVTANVDICVGILCLPNPASINGSIYNLQPQPGEPARFGIVLNALPFSLPVLGNLVLPPIKQQSSVELRDDLGLDTVLTDLPNTAEILRVGPLPPLTGDIRITQQTLTLFGKVGNKTFMRNPTSCKQQLVRFDATDHTDETATGQASFTTTGCDKIPFDPKLTATVGSPGHTAPASNPPLTTVIRQKANEAGLRRAEVILPPGVGADPPALGNVCPTPQFEASSCPASSIVGRATAVTPLLTQPLSGRVSIVQPLQPGGLPNLGVDLKGPLPLQLRGNFVLVPGPGNVFEGLPDTPITRFELNFEQDKLIATTRELCEPPPPVFHAEFDGHNDRKRSTDVAADVEGCGKAAKPTAKVKLRRSKSEHPRMKAKVKAGISGLKKMKLKLPKQLRFAGGRDFKRGAKASDGTLRAGKRKLKLKSDEGVTKFKVRVAKHGLDRVKTIKKGKRLRFPITVTDVSGDTTKIKAKAKAKAR